MSLRTYKAKRTLSKTPEPAGDGKHTTPAVFVVQKHHASRLHYDFRLAADGVLKSWAVPKGPSLNPAFMRLAIMVEDHPYDYKDFEGVIPEGNYGAGEVIVWDEGEYEVRGNMKTALAEGRLHLVLHGQKVKGEFTLFHLKDPDQPNAWVLRKLKDAHASTADVTASDRSVKSGRTLDEVAGRAMPMPRDLRPMLATATTTAFDREGWLYEVKWDGYRVIAELDGGDIRLRSRKGIDYTSTFATVTDTLRRIRHRTVLDGEVVVLDHEGISRFPLLRQYLLHGEGSGLLAYVAFDLLYLDGHDVRGLPLIERKQLLQSIIPRDEPRLRYSGHIIGRGKEFYALSAKRGLEGVMAKDGTSTYEDGVRSRHWLKVHTHLRQEAVICGFTEPRGSRSHIGALVLGVYEGRTLRYIGHAGGGLTGQMRTDLYERLQTLRTRSSPFATAPKTNAPVTWVRPLLVCEVRFTEWTADGRMRKPIFMGLRDDKKAKDVTKEVRSAPPQPELVTNAQKLYFPEDNITKGDVAAYYARHADLIVPYLKGRPQSLLRHPNGIDGESFFQKNIDERLPRGARTVDVRSSEGGVTRYLVCDNADGLLFMTNMGCIELNPWHSRVEALDYPDYAVFDLDPNGTPFNDVIRVAQVLHRVLDDIGVVNVCKTSGKRGLHVYVPLGARYTDDEARQFAELVCHLVHMKLPRITTMERSLARRPKGVYLDYLQNKRGQTLVAPYSVRPVAGAPISTPLVWREVRKGLDPKKFTLRTIDRRLARVGDLWTPVMGEGIDMRACVEKIRLMQGKKRTTTRLQ